MEQQHADQPRFVFVQPQVELTPSARRRRRAPLSDMDRSAVTRERAPVPTEPAAALARQHARVRRAGPPSPPQMRRQSRTASRPRPAAPQSQARADTPGESSDDPLRCRTLGTAPTTPRDQTPGGRTAPSSSPLEPGASQPVALCRAGGIRQPQRRRHAFGPAIQFDTKGVEFGPWIRRFVAQVKRNWFDAVHGDVAEAATSSSRSTCTSAARSPISRSSARRRSTSFNNAAFNALAIVESRPSRCRRTTRPTRRSSPSPSTTTRRRPRSSPCRRASSAELGWLVLLVGADACTSAGGSSASREHPVPSLSSWPCSDPRPPARARWRWRWRSDIGGEIVNCDSTAVYRGFDIGTDKVPLDEQRGIPHHLDRHRRSDRRVQRRRLRARRHRAPSARSTRAAALPILVGGTGFYYRALTRGLFPGPGRDAALRARLERLPIAAASSGSGGFVQRVDPASAAPHPAARSAAARPRARGLSPDRPAVDGITSPRRARRSTSVASCAIALRMPAALTCGARDAPRRRSSSRAA